MHNLAVSLLPEIDEPGQVEGSHMPPLQQAWMPPVTSRHKGAELWVCPWAKPEPLLWGILQLHIWT